MPSPRPLLDCYCNGQAVEYSSVGDAWKRERMKEKGSSNANDLG
jgi:hypothetical protein